MGLGPRKASLLHKLGQKQAWEMGGEELRLLVEKDRERRTISRAMGRLTAMLKDGGAGKKRGGGGKKKQAETLERLGLDPFLIAGLRKSGKSDSMIIKTMREKGLL